VPCLELVDVGKTRNVECGEIAQRVFSVAGVHTGDPFRRYWLSDRSNHALVDQGRDFLEPAFVPRDNFEARKIEAATGRTYVGDDYTSLRAGNRRAIDKALGIRVDPKPEKKKPHPLGGWVSGEIADPVSRRRDILQRYRAAKERG